MAIILHTAWQFCLRLNAYGIDLSAIGISWS